MAFFDEEIKINTLDVGTSINGTPSYQPLVVTGSLFEPNTPLLEKFQNLAEFVTSVVTHTVTTKRLDDIPEIGDFEKLTDAQPEG